MESRGAGEPEPWRQEGRAASARCRELRGGSSGLCNSLGHAAMSRPLSFVALLSSFGVLPSINEPWDLKFPWESGKRGESISRRLANRWHLP